LASNAGAARSSRGSTPPWMSFGQRTARRNPRNRGARTSRRCS
jgi:hypothetical protein